MRLPRDISGRQLAKALGKRFGCILTRQRGSLCATRRRLAENIMPLFPITSDAPRHVAWNPQGCGRASWHDGGSNAARIGNLKRQSRLFKAVSCKHSSLFHLHSWPSSPSQIFLLAVSLVFRNPPLLNGVPTARRPGLAAWRPSNFWGKANLMVLPLDKFSRGN